jgi:hypothetical protein
MPISASHYVPTNPRAQGKEGKYVYNKRGNKLVSYFFLKKKTKNIYKIKKKKTYLYPAKRNRGVDMPFTYVPTSLRAQGKEDRNRVSLFYFIFFFKKQKIKTKKKIEFVKRFF